MSSNPITPPINNSRRNWLLGGLSLGALGAVSLLRPSDNGANHSNYFQDLSNALDRADLSGPTMVIDKAALETNIRFLKNYIGNRFDYRIVAKSLPSLPLLNEVIKGTGSNRLMMFHQPFMTQVSQQLPNTDLLMGKPMPVKAAQNFYNAHKIDSGFNPEKQLQWLVDSMDRLQQYQGLAQALNTHMQINIELDVGLHRGGVQQDQELIDMLNLIEAEPLLSFSGFMGYEPHVAKLPGNKMGHRDKAMAIYNHRVAITEQTLGRSIANLTLNAGGSPTYRLYKDGKFPHNELAAGSCLVKPTDFDTPELAEHIPAAFIATPVLKVKDQTQLPGFDSAAKLMSLWDTNRSKAFFTYGGYWKANPESPKGLSVNPLFGRSTNQEMLNGSNSINLKADDWVFLRPTQSESVFLQFGDIAVYDQGEIRDLWHVFSATT